MPRENMLFQTNFDGNCQKASIFAKIRKSAKIWGQV